MAKKKLRSFKKQLIKLITFGWVMVLLVIFLIALLNNIAEKSQVKSTTVISVKEFKP